MIWKLNEDVVTANIGESEKLKTLWTSNIKKTQIGDQHVLGVVTKNKLHPSFKAKEGTTTVSDTLYQAPPVSSTDGSCTLQ